MAEKVREIQDEVDSAKVFINDATKLLLEVLLHTPEAFRDDVLRAIRNVNEVRGFLDRIEKKARKS